MQQNINKNEKIFKGGVKSSEKNSVKNKDIKNIKNKGSVRNRNGKNKDLNVKAKDFKIERNHMVHQRDYPRSDRISEAIHRYLSAILRDDCRDPRINSVTILSVKTTTNLALSRIYLTISDKTKIKETLIILNNAAGFFRTELAKKIHTRTIPRLEFLYDASLDEGNKIEALLEQIRL